MSKINDPLTSDKSYIQVMDSNFDSNENVYLKLTKASVPTACSFLLEWSPSLITIYFLGRTGNNV